MTLDSLPRAHWRGRTGLVPALLLVLGFATLGSAQPSGSLDAERVRQTVQSLADVIEREYVDPRVAAHVAEALRHQAAAGRFDGAATWRSLAETLNVELARASRYQHLRVGLVPPAIPASPSTEAAREASRAAIGRRTNFGFHRAEILAGNVALIDVRAFFRPAEAERTLVSAMRLLENADALIVDLRANGGGSPGTVAMLLSHLFDAADMPLFDIVPRPPGEARRYATLASVPDGSDATRPVYVLTSARTFSAGEGLAFILQERERATIVGERTAGAANPGRPHAVTPELEVTVPNGTVRTAVTGGNWEGTGVTPDVPVAAADALHEAHLRALRELRDSTSDEAWRARLESELRSLGAIRR